MPIPYKKIPHNQLFCHQRVYDLFDEITKGQVERWDLREVENEILLGGSLCSFCSEEEMDNFFEGLSLIDKEMPFLKFKEKGQHYAFELFLTPPDYWASRGAPLFWAYAARKFTYDKLPMSVETFREKYLSIVNELGIPFGEDDYAYCERFDAGGMSRGMVGGVFAKDALDILCKRLKKYQ